MTLTREERKRLAEEARKLAGECAEGRVPKLDPYTYCGCAAHEVAVRAGFPAGEDSMGVSAAEEVAQELAGAIPFTFHELDFEVGAYYNLISEATAREVEFKQDGALVFPLLALADALDESTP